MKIYKSIAVALLCMFSLILNGQNAESAAGKTSLSQILSDKSIEATTYWYSGDDTFLVVVTSYVKRLEDTKFTGRKLIIYKKQTSGFVRIYEFDAAIDRFVGLFPLGDNSNTLMTIWIGGSAYHFNVFNISAGKVSLSLESGSHNYPELVDLDNDGKEEILISEGAFLMDTKDKKVLSYPEKTDVFKWNGKNYVLIKTVPWKGRLDALKGEAP